MQHDFYRPAVVCRFQIGIDDKNNPIEWYHQFTCSSVFKRITKDSWIPLTKLIGDPIMQVDTDNPPYVSEDAEVDVNFVIVDASIPVGFWPSVAYSHNTFFRESVIDEIAYKANEDPYVYRSRLLKKIPRKKSVLDMGCGTGILSILSYKMGANNVLGIDIDEWAYKNSLEN